jgi:hypothetical protein
VHQDDDGMFVIRGRLEPEVGALLVRALTAVRETLYQRTRHQPAIEDRPSMAQQHADAMVVVAETAPHHGVGPGAAAEHYQVVVHVDAPVLTDPANDGNSALEDGIKISAETSRRLACDATRVVMVHGRDGRVVEVAARTRTIPPAIGRALHHRDPTCRFPGCTVRFGQGHHIRHWAEGGPTTLSNLALLCRGIIGPCTRKGSRSNDCLMASCDSGARTGRCCRTCRDLLACPTTHPARSGRTTMRRDSA